MSEDAYFRFWIFNNNSFSINVTVNGADSFSIPPNRSADYDVIAPYISVPYEQVTYQFWLVGPDGYESIVNFTVLVLNSNFVQIFNMAIPLLLTVIAIIVVLIAIVVVRRRRGNKKTS